MSIQDIGAIGELLGALTVLATLIYIAIQTRQTRIAAQQTSLIGLAEAYSRWRAALFNNPELATALDRANRKEEISSAEGIQLKALHLELFISAVVGSFTGQSGGPRSDSEHLLNVMRDNPSIVDEWKAQKSMLESLAPDLVVEVEAGLSNE